LHRRFDAPGMCPLFHDIPAAFLAMYRTAQGPQRPVLSETLILGQDQLACLSLAI